MPVPGRVKHSPSWSQAINRTIGRYATDGRGCAAERLTACATRNVTRA